MSKTVVRRKQDSEYINDFSDLHPLLQRIYTARSIKSRLELDRELSALLSYQSLLDIDKATERLIQAIKNEERILFIGDFDADGATSTALGVDAIRAFGGRFVDYVVPDRFTYGYGLTPEIVEVVAREKVPQLIVTVDNGISSHAGVEKANEFGIDVIITDHHLPAKTLPAAVAIVNPNRIGDPTPSKCMAGVGVIFYVMCAVRARLQEQGWFEQQNITMPNMAHFLDLVTLGTVADVVPLDKNNRILVHQGLRRIRNGLMRPGIAALIQVSGRNVDQLQAADLGYALGPRLNAAGRLDDMSIGIACLLAKTEAEALQLAQQLDELNRERKAIEGQMREEAMEYIEQLNLSKRLPRGLCLYNESWHQGVVGLVASKVKEKIHRPVIAFAKADDNCLKGSARSVSGLHVRDLLESIATKHPDLIQKFGGHAMAAGLSIAADRYEAFQQAFIEEVEQHLDEEDLQGRIWSDGELQLDEFSLEVAELLRNSGPWGQSFPEPLFDGEFTVIDQRLVGERHLKLILQPDNSNYYIDAIAFHINVQEWPNYHCSRVHAAFKLDINHYRGMRKVQCAIEYLKAID